ncbi:nucleotidyl transferase AbiEii/AbiGii toxin family protein [Luteibacter sp. CQ10]|uniref:nucleotidyl transferase AbiEii/AbiGii toxin family protein n=1 Tax=Luteibacter sp. CQ10 TaxID=2805821 RepID=UPI0034A5AA8A
MLKLRNSAPLDATSRAIIHEVTLAAKDVGVRIMLVGASARDIIMSHVYDLPQHRATNDVDFAVAIHGWDTFDMMISRLLDTPRFTGRPGLTHRLYYKASPTSHEVFVDIVPFGPGVGGPRFRWPQDPDIEMNVEGYPDAAEAASIVDVGDATIEVPSVPGLALLKLFAWNDRHSATRKDANDLAILLRNYSELGNGNRMYDEPSLLDGVDHDYVRGSARLLGRDVRRLCSVTTLTEVRKVVTQENLHRLALDAYNDRWNRDDRLDFFREIFGDFAGELQT